MALIAHRCMRCPRAEHLHPDEFVGHPFAKGQPDVITTFNAATGKPVTKIAKPETRHPIGIPLCNCDECNALYATTTKKGTAA